MFTFIRIVKSFKVRTVGSNLILNSISYTQSFIKRRHRYQRMWSRYGIQNISSITNICKYPYRGIYILTTFSIIEKKEFEEKGRIIGKKRKREKNNFKRVSVLKGGKWIFTMEWKKAIEIHSFFLTGKVFECFISKPINLYRKQFFLYFLIF